LCPSEANKKAKEGWMNLFASQSFAGVSQRPAHSESPPSTSRTAKAFTAWLCIVGLLAPVGTAVAQPMTWQYGYDAMGRPTTVVDPNGLATYTYYDSLGRPIQTQQPPNTGSASPTVTGFAYKFDPRPKSIHIWPFVALRIFNEKTPHQQDIWRDLRCCSHHLFGHRINRIHQIFSDSGD
jgi:YD repeat-containing protein